MKKIFAIIFSLLLVISLASCKNKTKENDTFKIVSENGTELKIEYLKVENFGDNKIYINIKDNKLIGLSVEFDSSKYAYKEAKLMVGSFNVEYDYTKESTGIFNFTNPINLVVTDGDAKTPNTKNVKFTPVLTELSNGEATTTTVSYELSMKMHDLVDFLEIEHDHE